MIALDKILSKSTDILRTFLEKDLILFCVTYEKCDHIAYLHRYFGEIYNGTVKYFQCFIFIRSTFF